MSQKILAKDLVGLEVVGPRGWRIGKVKNVPVDTSTWQVSEFEVELEKEVAERLNMKRHFRGTVIQVRTEKVTGVGNVISINYTQEDIDKLMGAEENKK